VKADSRLLRSFAHALNELTSVATGLGMMTWGDEHKEWGDNFVALIDDIIVSLFGCSFDVYWDDGGFVLPVLCDGKLALLAFSVDSDRNWYWTVHTLDQPIAKELLTKMALADTSLKPCLELEECGSR